MRALLAAALAVLCAAPALAQTPLFTPVNGTQRLALAPQQSHYLRALESELGIEAVDLVTADVRQLDAKATLELALPGVTVTLEAISATPRATGHLSWAGRAETGSGISAWAVLVERDGQITGEIHTGGYVYPVRPLTGGLHAVARKSMAEYQTHPDGYDAFVEANEERITLEREAEAHAHAHGAHTPRSGARRVTATVDVLVPYTTNVTAAIADPVALAQSFVDYSNLTYDNSGLPDLELRLVAAYETPFASSGDLEDDLTNIRGTADGISDEVHVWRDAYGADLVALIAATNTFGLCGIAYVNSSSTSAFSANSASCGAATFTHEVGHNFGSGHDPTTGGVIAYSYGQGYINDVGKWGTVMGYNNACTGSLCEIIPYLSNPDVDYDDTTSPEDDGPTGNATTADNARVHEERATALAAFRAESTPAELDLTTTSISTTVQVGGTTSATIQLANVAAGGASNLEWQASINNAMTASRSARRAGNCTSGQTANQSAFNTFFSGSVEVGQSFVAPCRGVLTTVSPTIYYNTSPGTSWTATLRVYEGDGTGGTEIASGAVSHTNGASGTASVPVALSSPPELSEGSTYTWFLDLTSGTTTVGLSSSNPDPDG
ncbi:MAG: zinc-dependent metalloprotease family protein, partial [Bacteroidota bacterium]